MILPDCLNYCPYHSSTQTADHPKKASGTSGTSQHAPITQHPELRWFCTGFNSQHVPLNFISFIKLPLQLQEQLKSVSITLCQRDELPTSWDQQEGNKKQVKQVLCDND